MKTVLAASLYITCEFHQITNHRLAVNVFCVRHVYIWNFDVLSPQFVAILCFSTCSNEFSINLSIYWLVYAKAIAKTQDCELCFFLLHFYLWIFVFLDLEMNPEFKTVLRTFPTKIWLADQRNLASVEQNFILSTSCCLFIRYLFGFDGKSLFVLL